MTELILIALLVTSSPQKNQMKEGGIGILRLDPLGGVQPDVATALTQILAHELGKITRPVLAGKELLKGLPRRLRRCEGQDRCLRAIGRRHHLRWMMVGTVASLADNYLINVKLMDLKSRDKPKRISVTISGDPDVLIDEISILAYRMLAPGDLSGTLRIVTNLPGAEVYIDGKKVGRTPLKPLTLREGTYELRITSPGYVEFRRKVSVRFRKATLVEVKMDRLPKPEPRPVAKTPVPTPLPRPKPVRKRPFYEKPWFVGAAAVLVGVVGFAVGYSMGGDTVQYDVEWVR